MKSIETCNCCGSNEIKRFRVSKDVISIEELSSDNFAVTDKDYGKCVETVRCNECGLIQPAHELDVSHIVRLYSEMTDDEYLKGAEMRGESNYEQVRSIIDMHKPNTQSLLEVGAGNGYMLKLFKQDGMSVTGVEPNTSFCENAQSKYDVHMDNCGYESFESEEMYDVIVGLDVIEHVVNVDHFMKAMSRLLKPDGLLILCTPNKKSIAAKILGKKWWHIRPPHLYYFTPKTFGALAKNNNLEVTSQNYFYWTFPLYYLCDALQKLVLKRSFFTLSFLTYKIKLNTFDSHIYTLCKK